MEAAKIRRYVRKCCAPRESEAAKAARQRRQDPSFFRGAQLLELHTAETLHMARPSFLCEFDLSMMGT